MVWRNSRYWGQREKKSNICYIYHRPKLSPDDPDTSTCDSCDEKGKNAYERPNHYDRQKKYHDSNHGNCLKKWIIWIKNILFYIFELFQKYIT